MDALRHGWPLEFAGGPTLLPVETAVAGKASARRMLISAARAATLKLTNQRAAATPDAPVLIEAAEPFTLNLALAIADPSADLTHPLMGPFRALDVDGAHWGEALALARIAGILPAFLVDPEDAGEAHHLEPGDFAAWNPVKDLAIATRAHLPIAADEDAELVAFRSADDLREHLALVVGQQTSDKVPLVRLHSECLTGDVLGSLKCDCGPQLDAALAAMAAEAKLGGWGVLLYLRQEGRGIGLVNKLRAYRLQDQGFDTLEANRRLGFPEEARDFELAARMLELLGVGDIRLMTNNLEKVVALEDSGVKVTERVPHQLPANPHNERYLATKRDAAGHLLK